METLKQVWDSKYPKRLKVLTLFEQATGVDATWENLSKVNLAKFVDYLRDVVSTNSAKTYAAMFKSVISVYSDEVALPKGYEKILSLKGEASVSTWLTDDEINRIIEYSPHTETEEIVKNQFILGCLTGARHSDYVTFNQRNIQNGKLVYVSKKTRIRSEVPLSPAVERILENEIIDKTFADTTFNYTIREICRKVGIVDVIQIYHAGENQEGEKWRFVSSHTARRSFATNVYLRCRDIFMVSRYMGHSSVDMTAKYILSIGDAPEEVRAYFEQFQ